MFFLQFALYASLILTLFIGGLRLGTQRLCHSRFITQALRLETSRLTDHSLQIPTERVSALCKFLIIEKEYGQEMHDLTFRQNKSLHFRLKTRIDYESAQ